MSALYDFIDDPYEYDLRTRLQPNFAFEFRGKEELNLKACYKGNEGDEFVPIGKQFTVAFECVKSEKEGLEWSYNSIKEELTNPRFNELDINTPKHDEFLSLDDSLTSTWLEINDYNILESLVDIYSDHEPLSYVTLSNILGCINLKNMPKLRPTYETIIDFDSTEPIDSQIRKYCESPLLLENFNHMVFSVDNFFQLCVATIMYLSMAALPLHKCRYCGSYFIPVHRNEHYCSDECREINTQLINQINANKPLRKSRKRLNDRLRNKTDLRKLNISYFDFADTNVRDNISQALNDDNFPGLIEILNTQINLKLKNVRNDKDMETLINWIDNLGRSYHKHKHHR